MLRCLITRNHKQHALLVCHTLSPAQPWTWLRLHPPVQACLLSQLVGLRNPTGCTHSIHRQTQNISAHPAEHQQPDAWTVAPTGHAELHLLGKRKGRGQAYLRIQSQARMVQVVHTHACVDNGSMHTTRGTSPVHLSVFLPALLRAHCINPPHLICLPQQVCTSPVNA